MGEGAVAVTGDVGAGKSTASRLLAEGLGCPCFDADAVALGLWRREDVKGAAVARWGGGILGRDGEILRGAVAGRIFSSPEEYRWCCALLHPLVMAGLTRLVRGAAGRAVVEIPLLFEVEQERGLPDWIAAKVFVTAPWEERVRRCRERGWNEIGLREREAFFLPPEERRRRSDFVIVNDGDMGHLEVEVGRIIRLLTKGPLSG